MDTMTNTPVHESVEQHAEAVAEAYQDEAAIAHFRKHQHKAPNWVMNAKGPWADLSDEEREADILTAEWVPNRAMWRAKGYKGREDAIRRNLETR